MSEPALPTIVHPTRDRFGQKLLNWFGWIRDTAQFAASRITFDGTSSGLSSADVQAALGELKTVGAAADANHVTALHSIYHKDLAPTTTIVHQANNVPNLVGRGVFVPKTSSVLAILNLGGLVYGNAQLVFNLIYGIAPTPGPHDPPGWDFDVHYVPAVEQLMRRMVGSLFAPGGDRGRPVLITGLTPNQPYTYNVEMSDSSYASRKVTGGGPQYMAIYDFTGATPTGANTGTLTRERCLAVTMNTDKTIEVYAVVNNFGDKQQTMNKVATIASGSGVFVYPQFSPDGKYLCGPFLGGGGQLKVIDSWIDSATRWSVLRTVTLTGLTGGAPFAVAINSTSTVAYVTGNNAIGQVLPVTLATGALGTIIATSANPTVIRARPTTSELWVGCGNGDVCVIDTTTNTVTHTIATGSSAVQAIAFKPDGSKAYVGRADGLIKEVTCSSYTVGTRSISLSGPPAGLDVTPDGLVLAASDTTVSNVYWIRLDTTALEQYDSDLLPGGSTISHQRISKIDGQLFYTQRGINEVFTYWGLQSWVGGITAGLFGLALDLTILGALAGSGD